MCIRDRKWAGHVQRMDDERMVKIIMKHKPIGKRKIERPKNRWLDQVGSDARNLGAVNWWRIAEDKNKWRQFLKARSGM